MAATAALILGVFSIGDCVRFQTQRGECNELVERHTMPMALGLLTIAGTVGAFFTVNPMLDRAKQKVAVAPPPAKAFRIPPNPGRGQPVAVEDERVERVQFMAARGLAVEQIGEATGMAPGAVREILARGADLEPGL